jgi:hypothetical protein
MDVRVALHCSDPVSVMDSGSGGELVRWRPHEELVVRCYDGCAGATWGSAVHERW